MTRKPVATDVPARTKLAKALAGDGWSQSALAARLGIGQPNIHHWLIGTSRPKQVYREAMWRLFEIPVDDWKTAAELRLEATLEVPDGEAERSA